MARTGSIIAGAVLAAAIAAGGSAVTNSNTAPAESIVGYSTTMVSGGTISSLVYSTNAAGDSVTSVTVTFAGDTTDATVKVGFNNGVAHSCGTGVFGSSGTTYACDDAGTFPQPTNGLASTQVLINSTT